MTGPRPRRSRPTPKRRPSRASREKVLVHLKLASRGGDSRALQIALAEMRTLAHSPRYWEKYLALLRNPLARLVDLLVIKQGGRIAELKGWTHRPGSAQRERSRGRSHGSVTANDPPDAAADRQPSLF